MFDERIVVWRRIQKRVRRDATLHSQWLHSQSCTLDSRHTRAQHTAHEMAPAAIGIAPGRPSSLRPQVTHSDLSETNANETRTPACIPP